MIYIAGISIALFIAALILNKRDKSNSDFVLFGWMLFMALHLCLFYINFNENRYETPWLLGVELPMPILHGVFLYFYVILVTNQVPKRKYVLLLHLVPISCLYLYLIDFFMQSNDHKVDVYLQGGAPYATFTFINTVLIHLSGIVYVIWSSILLRNHKKNIRAQFSTLDDIDLRWLQFLTLSLGAIWIVVTVTNQVSYIFMSVSIFVVLIGFFGLQQKNIFSGKKAIAQPQIGTENKGDKYVKSGLTEEKANKMYKNLLNLIREELIYRKHDLSLNELASILDIHPNYLSQIINEKEEKNFFDFVNAFRVEEFKRRIMDKKNHQFTLMAIAYDCGFNSKSSFIRYFKKYTGQTPSQYFKENTPSAGK